MLPLFGLVLPFVLWPIETLLPYPHLIEELGKGFLILLLPESSAKDKILKTFFMAAFFTLSESALYLFNISLLGNTNTLLLRMLLTFPLHIGTSLVILLPTLKSKKLIPIGLIIAIAIHYVFNERVKALGI